MAAYAHLGNNIYVGITTDTKPTAANTANGALAFEFATNYATFTLYVNNQTTWLPATEFAETIKNKTIDSTNTVSSATSLPTVTVAKGGTGATTATLGFDALSPMSAVGDLIVGSTAGTRIRLARGTANQALKVNSGGTDLDYGTLPVAGGGTGAVTLTGILKGNGTSAVTAGATVAVNEGGTGATTLTGILKGNGTSAVTAAALLAVADGGTGAGTLTGVVSGNGTSAFTASNTLAGLTLTTPIINGIKGGDVAITNADSPYTALATTRVIRADATSGAITINLPTAVGIAGFEYHIFRTDIASSTNIITIDANSTETIDSNLTYRLYPGEYVKIESDGANWQVLARPTPTVQGYHFLKGSTANRRYVFSQGNCTAFNISTTSPAINTLWVTPITISKTTQFDIGSIVVGTVSTSGNSRIGLYRDNGNMYPGALLWDSGAIVTTGTGQKDATISPTITLQPGLYWSAYEQDTATGQYRILGNSATVNSVLGTDLGASNHAFAYTVAHTFGSLPDPFTGGATLVTTQSAVGTPIVAVGWRPV